MVGDEVVSAVDGSGRFKNKSSRTASQANQVGRSRRRLKKADLELAPDFPAAPPLLAMDIPRAKVIRTSDPVNQESVGPSPVRTLRTLRITAACAVHPRIDSVTSGLPTVTGQRCFRETNPRRGSRMLAFYVLFFERTPLR